MKNIILYSLMLSYSLTTATAQSALISPGSIGVPNVVNNPTCNTAAKGNQVYNTTANKMYFCDGTSWVDMTVGGFTLPYSGSGTTVNPTHLFSLTSSGSGAAFYAENTGNGRAIYGKSLNSAGVRGESINSIGLYGISTSSYGIYGYSSNGIGVYAESSDNYAIYAYSYGSHYSAYINGRANVSSRLAIGPISYANAVARLHIKGLDTGSWGQHIRMVDKDSDNYGDILYDADGMKFRNFEAGDEFAFRNSANSTLVTIQESGDLTVRNNKGIVRSNSSTQLKVVRSTVNFTANGIAVGGFIDSGGTLNYENFGDIPTVTMGQINNSSATGEWYKVLIIPIDVTATECKFRLFNMASDAISFTGSWRVLVVGPQ